MKSKILLMVAVFALPLLMQANNVRVKLNSYNAATKQLNITLAWDNSWHDGSGQFRDAAWLFVKYKDITNPEWQHAVLGTPNGAGGNTPAVLTDTLNSPGVLFDVQAKRAGVSTGAVTGYMVRRQKSATVATQNNPEYAGVYNVAMNFNVVVTLPAGVTLANPEFRVYALEMVDIPQGSFWAGDGSANSWITSNTTTKAPLNLTTVGGGLSFTNTVYFNGSGGVSLSSNFPNGVAEFFIMKYELSNEGYCEFLNTLTRTQQNALAPDPGFTTAASGIYRSPGAFFNVRAASVTSLNEPAIFGCDANMNGIFNEINDATNNGATVNYMRDVLAYLDWCGLRTMSGYEYEKACRGPLTPVPGEYAWGSPVVNSPRVDVDLFGPNETSSSIVEGPGAGPGLRNGAFAKSTGSTRLNSGGSYYGVMELSNSGDEPHFGYGDNPFWNLWSANNSIPPNGDGVVNATYSSYELAIANRTVSNLTPTYLLPLYVNADAPLSVASPGNTNVYPSRVCVRGIIK